MLSPRLTLEKLNKLLGAWEDLAADKSFAGMTFAEFQAKVKPSLDARDAIQKAAQIVDGVTARQTADVLLSGILQPCASEICSGRKIVWSIPIQLDQTATCRNAFACPFRA